MEDNKKTSLEKEVNDIDYFVAPIEKYKILATPTSELIAHLLACIKSCQQEELDYVIYQDMCEKILKSFIEFEVEI